MAWVVATTIRPRLLSETSTSSSEVRNAAHRTSPGRRRAAATYGARARRARRARWRRPRGSRLDCPGVRWPARASFLLPPNSRTCPGKITSGSSQDWLVWREAAVCGHDDFQLPRAGSALDRDLVEKAVDTAAQAVRRPFDGLRRRLQISALTVGITKKGAMTNRRHTLVAGKIRRAEGKRGYQKSG